MSGGGNANPNPNPNMSASVNKAGMTPLLVGAGAGANRTPMSSAVKNIIMGMADTPAGKETEEDAMLGGMRYGSPTLSDISVGEVRAT